MSSNLWGSLSISSKCADGFPLIKYKQFRWCSVSVFTVSSHLCLWLNYVSGLRPLRCSWFSRLWLQSFTLFIRYHSSKPMCSHISALWFPTSGESASGNTIRDQIMDLLKLQSSHTRSMTHQVFETHHTSSNSFLCDSKLGGSEIISAPIIPAAMWQIWA